MLFGFILFRFKNGNLFLKGLEFVNMASNTSGSRIVVFSLLLYAQLLCKLVEAILGECPGPFVHPIANIDVAVVVIGHA